MSVVTVVSILTAIPWDKIFEHGPTLLDSARGIFKKSIEHNAKETLEDRVERLERNEKEQAQLIEQLVERQELLLSTIQVISSRLKALFACTIVAVIGLITSIVILFIK